MLSLPCYINIDIRNYFASVELSDSWKREAARVSVAILPFFTLYKPLSYPLVLTMGGSPGLCDIQGLMGRR